MKKRKQEDGAYFFQAMGGIDPNIIQEVESMEEKPRKKKWKHVLIVAACGVCLVGATSGLVRELTGGMVFEWKNQSKTGYRISAQDITDKVYEEREDGLYYIFDGAEKDITTYCSETDYVLIPCLDEGGNGYVMVIGGEKGGRGYMIKHFETGDFLVGQGSSERYGEELSWNPGSFAGKVSSSYPQLVWNHHATHFLGSKLSEEWFGDPLPETLETTYGIAEKVDENMYYVQGEPLDFYLDQEVEWYVISELQYRIDWMNGIGAQATSGESVMIAIYKDWTKEREAEVEEVLDETGFIYTVEFVGDSERHFVE